MQKITPFIWFDGQAEDAARFYVSVFKNARITAITRYTDLGPGPKDSAMTVSFELDGQAITALNGGPHYKLSEAFSLVVNCETQDEVDYYWDALSEGGATNVCGWLKDRFGLSWQVTPTVLTRLIADPDKAKVARVMAAMMQMTKLDVAKIEAAAAAPNR